MKLEKGDFGTAIFLEPDEVEKLCRPGAGADTCIWAMVGDRGPECGYYNRHPELVRRWEAGETVAKRDGCDVARGERRKERTLHSRIEDLNERLRASRSPVAKYWEEAEALADALMPIPPRICLDSDGVAIRTDRCLQCPMKTECELKQSTA